MIYHLILYIFMQLYIFFTNVLHSFFIRYSKLAVIVLFCRYLCCYVVIVL